MIRGCIEGIESIFTIYPNAVKEFIRLNIVVPSSLLVPIICQLTHITESQVNEKNLKFTYDSIRPIVSLEHPKNRGVKKSHF